MFKRILLLIKPYWGRIAAATMMSFFISGMSGGLAWLVKPALNGIFVKRDAVFPSAFTMYKGSAGEFFSFLTALHQISEQCSRRRIQGNVVEYS